MKSWPMNCADSYAGERPMAHLPQIGDWTGLALTICACLAGCNHDQTFLVQSRPSFVEAQTAALENSAVRIGQAAEEPKPTEDNVFLAAAVEALTPFAASRSPDYSLA